MYFIFGLTFGSGKGKNLQLWTFSLICIQLPGAPGSSER